MGACSHALSLPGVRQRGSRVRKAQPLSSSSAFYPPQEVLQPGPTSGTERSVG
jgi:hypothetical protein